jgi:hypothetical protein
VAKVVSGALRSEMEQLSSEVQAGTRSRIDILAFWRAKAAAPLTESLLGPVFSETARAILTLQLSSGASERRFKAVKRILTMDSCATEDLFVVRDWLHDGKFTEWKFDQLLTAMKEIIAKDKSN